MLLTLLFIHIEVSVPSFKTAPETVAFWCMLIIFYIDLSRYLQLFYKKTKSFIVHNSARDINNKQKSHLHYKKQIKTTTGLQDKKLYMRSLCTILVHWLDNCVNFRFVFNHHVLCLSV